MTCQVLKRRGAPDLAYDFWAGSPNAPVILYLSGYRGDRTGAKYTALSAHIPAHTPFGLIGFDYQGHGESDGSFDGAVISDWFNDAQGILNQVAPKTRTIIVIGSSMGGWLGLGLMINHPDRIAGFIGIAAAPDFTRTMMNDLTPAQQDQLNKTGRVTIPSNIPGYDPYDFTQNFLNDGNNLSIFWKIYPHTHPLALIHGDQDAVVPGNTPDLIAAAFPNAPVHIERIIDGDHSLARPQDMEVLYATITRMAQTISGDN
jgi:pimeloyl-ACP methyl ester carboxylesterase